MPRLVIVSNRVALPGGGSERAGGLAVAMRDALRGSGGLWFGWSGEVGGSTSTAPRVVRAGRVEYATIDLSRSDHEQYYNGFANSTLWPLLHYRLGLLEFHRENLDAYRRVNRAFATALHPLLRSDDLIWVHDYHLLALAQNLRRLGLGNRIGLFLHTPFPPPAVFTALPRHEILIEALAAYDVIGLQTEGDRRNLSGVMAPQANPWTYSGETTKRPKLRTIPIGIDAEALAGMAVAASRSSETERLIDSLDGRRLIVGVDRLDYSKGLPLRFEAFERLLAEFPEHRSNVTFMQVAPVSRGEVRQYRELRRELERLAGRVNGKYAEFDWVPIRYLNRSFNRRVLAGFFRHARVGLVTPLRDGMNLVAKEYVAAQDPSDPGALVLSRFAGAAAELTDALLVNPYDPDAMAEALHQALGMALDERRERWQAMMHHVETQTATAWQTQFLDLLRNDEAVPALA